MLALTEIVTGDKQDQNGSKGKKNPAGEAFRAECRNKASNRDKRKDGHQRRKHRRSNLEPQAGLACQPYRYGAHPPDVWRIHVHDVFAEGTTVKQAPGKRQEVGLVVIESRQTVYDGCNRGQAHHAATGEEPLFGGLAAHDCAGGHLRGSIAGCALKALVGAR